MVKGSLRGRRIYTINERQLLLVTTQLHKNTKKNLLYSPIRKHTPSNSRWFRPRIRKVLMNIALRVLELDDLVIIIIPCLLSVGASPYVRHYILEIHDCRPHPSTFPFDLHIGFLGGPEARYA